MNLLYKIITDYYWQNYYIDINFNISAQEHHIRFDICLKLLKM